MSINVLANEVARYTSSKVRQAVFNMIGDIEGRSVLELFAGSGSFSIEGLSRGASSATLVEADRRMTGLIANNLARTGLNNIAKSPYGCKICRPLYFDGNAFMILFSWISYEMGYVMQI